MSLYNGPPRPGARGGRAEFSWEAVKNDKDREYYLGHSVKALAGRWQKNKDVYWYTREKGEGDSMRDEIEAIKQKEKELMDEALGLKPKRAKPISAPSLDKEDMDKLFSKREEEGGEQEDPDRIKGLGFAMAGMGPSGEVRETLQGTGLSFPPPPPGPAPAGGGGSPAGGGMLTLEQLQAMADKEDNGRGKKSKKEKKTKKEKKARKEKKAKHKEGSSKHSNKRKKEQQQEEGPGRHIAKRRRHYSDSSSGGGSSSSGSEDERGHCSRERPMGGDDDRRGGSRGWDAGRGSREGERCSPAGDRHYSSREAGRYKEEGGSRGCHQQQQQEEGCHGDRRRHSSRELEVAEGRHARHREEGREQQQQYRSSREQDHRGHHAHHGREAERGEERQHEHRHHSGSSRRYGDAADDERQYQREGRRQQEQHSRGDREAGYRRHRSRSPQQPGERGRRD